jgi:hypothetical protein
MERGASWSLQDDFQSASILVAPKEPIDVWAQLAQILMLSNEFAFVD